MNAVTYLPSQFRWTPQQLVDAMSREPVGWFETGMLLAPGPCANDSVLPRRRRHPLALRGYQPEPPRFELFHIR